MVSSVDEGDSRIGIIGIVWMDGRVVICECWRKEGIETSERTKKID